MTRVLVVSNLYPPAVVGGYEVECSGVVEHLRARFDVHVLTSVRGREPGDAAAGVRRELPFVAYGKADSVRAPLDAARAARIARRTLDELRPDLLFVWNGTSIPQTALRVLSLSGVPLAFRVCEHWFGGLYRGDLFLRHLPPGETGLRGAWAHALRAVNRIDPALRLELDRRTPAAVSWNAEFMKATVGVPPGIDVVFEDVLLPVNPRVPRFAEVARREAPGDPVIAFAGRLDDRKGADVAIRALAALRDRHGVRARLVLAGAGDERQRAELEALVAALGLDGAVELPGPLAFEALAGVLGGAAAWVIPSLWDEPAPTVALEAGMAQVPAVVSRVGGAPEVLRDGTEALFFERGDHDGCADRLAAVLADPDATAERVRRAHARALELSHAHYLERIDRFVDGALDALGGRAPVAA